jgi:alginate O-acetyltransferase complex protein AlgI
MWPRHNHKFHSLGSLSCINIQFLRKAVFFVPFVLMIVGVVIGRALFADSDFGRLLEKLSFHYDGFVILTKLVPLTNTIKTRFIARHLIHCCSRNGVSESANISIDAITNFIASPIVQLILLIITLVIVYDESGVDYAVYGQR